jgi:hypothetical protein
MSFIISPFRLMCRPDNNEISATNRFFDRGTHWLRIAFARALTVAAVFSCCLSPEGLAAVDGARSNLVRNGSFEGGADFHFSMGRWYINGLPSASLDDTTQVHGRHSLRIPFSRTALLKKPARIQGIQFRSAVPVMLDRDQEYYFSVYLKSDETREGRILITPNSPSEYRGKPIAIHRIEVGKSWKRVGLKFRPPEHGPVYWEIDVRSQNAGFLWIDAVQLERDAFTAFSPRTAVETGLVSDRLGMIYAPDEPVTLTLMAYNDSNAEIDDFPFKVAVYDLNGRNVYSTAIPQTLPPKTHFRKDITLPIRKMGIYRSVLSAASSPETLSEIHFSVLPRPRAVDPRQSAFGAYLTIAPEPLSIARRLGFRWIAHLTSNGQLYAWDFVEPKENEFLWYDEDIALARSEGYQMMFNLEPYKAPSWALGLDEREKLEKWTNYVTAMVRHYRDDAVRYWTISDEAQAHKLWVSPQDYARWHRAGYEAIKRADPGAKVVFNTSAEHAAQVLQAMPPRYVDIIAGNFYHVPLGMERLQKIAVQHDIRDIWAPGVGRWTLPFYRQHISREQLKHLTSDDYWVRNVTDLVKSVIQSFAHGTKRLFHYTATYVGNTNNFSIFESDSGLKPNGAQFAALIWLVDGFSRAEAVRGAASLKNQSVAVFRIDRLDGNTVFAFWSERSPAGKLNLRHIGNTGGVRLYDQFANLLPLEMTARTVILEPGYSPLFLMVPRTLADAVEKSFVSVLS